jgi:L-iditol 2-dehydrogenase
MPITRLPDNVSLDLGALAEPLGVAIHAVRRARLQPKSKVLVFGAGTVGLLCAVAAKKLGGTDIVAIADIDQGRLDFATSNGFADISYAVPLKRGGSLEENLAIAEDTASELGKLQKSGQKPIGEYDVVFECTGVASPLQASVYVSLTKAQKYKLMTQKTDKYHRLRNLVVES